MTIRIYRDVLKALKVGDIVTVRRESWPEDHTSTGKVWKTPKGRLAVGSLIIVNKDGTVPRDIAYANLDKAAVVFPFAVGDLVERTHGGSRFFDTVKEVRKNDGASRSLFNIKVQAPGGALTWHGAEYFRKAVEPAVGTTLTVNGRTWVHKNTLANGWMTYDEVAGWTYSSFAGIFA